MEDEKFVLFIDILGFSQLAANNPVAEVAQIYDSNFRQTALACNMISSFKCGNPAGVPFQVRTSPFGALQDIVQDQLVMHIMSDSLVAWTKDTSPESLLALSNFAAQFIGTTVKLGLPLRGGISKGSAQLIQQPLNGRITTNAYGTGVIAAHNYEAVQEWMGCAIDRTCLSIFSEYVAHDLLTLAGSTLCKYQIPYKGDTKQFTSDIAVDWRSCLRESTPNADYSFFLEQFGRHNKSVNNSVERKIRSTFEFYSALRAS